ncbi:trypsin delta-like [Planococcus citri]|uniref:trypsin delta-like n=1 Tax=Planococcus citri TaxID=170843 RepID=UPI0031F92B56
MGKKAHNILFGVFIVIFAGLIAIILYLCISNSICFQKQVKKVNKKCQEYNEQACKLSDQSSPAIDELQAKINQDDAVPGQFPHQAFIELVNSKKSTVHLCGGSLISEYFVLTAAHCIIQAGGNPKIQVELGNVFLKSGKEYKVKEFHVHPGFSEKRIYNDIALLKLDTKVNFSSTIRPICLNTDYNIEKYHNATTSGWGLERLASGKIGNSTSNLKIIKLRIDEKHESICGVHPAAYDEDSQRIICTHSSEEDKHEGDAGGPLQVWSKGCSDGKTTLYELLAVNSRNVKPRTPDKGRGIIFIKIEPYIRWIGEIVWP